MVEITLRPKWAFENGNIGALTLLAMADQVVCAVPPHPAYRHPAYPLEKPPWRRACRTSR
jgi:hypothetical protein